MKNNNLMEIGIISKIKRWLNQFFHKTYNNQNVSNTEIHGKSLNQLVSQKESQNIFDKYRYIENRRQYLLKLQKKLEGNTISENELSDKDKADLEKLYIEQISELQRAIHNIGMKIKKLQ